MKIRKPDYYDGFQCIAGACKDSCCIGWEIDVDEEKREQYRQLEGQLGERMQRDVDWEHGHFILQGKEERCPFLNQEHLCDLILELGEDSLCEICREHPRFYDWYEDFTEVGLGLCCEEAARLILTHEGAVQFITEESDEEDLQGEWIDEQEAEWVDVLLTARETAFFLLQNRKASIWERLDIFWQYTAELQDCLEFGAVDEILESARYYRETVSGETEELDISVYQGILRDCRELEVMDASWPETLKELERMLEDEDSFWQAEAALTEIYGERDCEYEQILVYLVYRYFMKARIDRNIYARGCLAVFFVRLVRLLDVYGYQKTGTLTTDDRIEHAKRCSKEIEYNEDNLERLAELFLEYGLGDC